MVSKQINKTSDKFVYFIVVTWNNEDIIQECLHSIKKQTYQHVKTIVVDNSSSDNTVRTIHKNFKDVQIIENPNNDGFAIANNMGIKLALNDPKCGYVALLNSDARIDPDWTLTLVKFSDNHPKSAGLQTITLDYYDHKVLDSRGIKIDPKGNAIQLGYREPRTKKYETKQVFGVNAAACIYTANYLKNQPFGDDYFDSDMWMYLEDVDLAARSVIMGYENWLVPGSLAYHMGSASSSKNPGFSVYYIYRNNLLMLLKNMPVSHVLKITPHLLYHDIKTIYGLGRTKNYITAKALIRGRLASVPKLPLFIRKRRRIKVSVSKAHLDKLMRAN